MKRWIRQTGADQRFARTIGSQYSI